MISNSEHVATQLRYELHVVIVGEFMNSVADFATVIAG